MNTSVMELCNVSVRYKTRRAFFRHDYFTALDDVSFTIHKGETLGVIGSNGCGKSTLLRVLANIYGVDDGTVHWHCKQVSLLSLSLGFDVELSGRDNAIISGMLLGGRKKDVVAEAIFQVPCSLISRNSPIRRSGPIPSPFPQPSISRSRWQRLASVSILEW